ncbi:ferredoxin [Halogranum amylolyticum]|uniref:Ferredoxin n=1 Tax=Halogranum amylolyticum TaxID=660520 RepID=A0A1H8RX21_9EURY|nr:2Fe-2S iron-sulfur cluster-binding protein [Halogranum amylolyticum]SEO70473.1 ferredoxin [Halogranum amylolyticum]
MDVRLRWRDGEETVVAATADQSILEAAERADVAVPFGCRTGACATCAGRVESGEVVHRRPPRALKRRHLDSGYVLCCIAEPRTDCAVVVGKDVAAELVSNPWR